MPAAGRRLTKAARILSGGRAGRAIPDQWLGTNYTLERAEFTAS